jgi:GAF domain-containing protein
MAHEQGKGSVPEEQLTCLAELIVLERPDIDQILTNAARAAAMKPHWSCGITYKGLLGVFTVASSDDRAHAVDELQYAHGDGPCLQALRTGEPTRIDDLERESRWGDYPKMALEAGVRSSLSYPILVETDSVGAVNVYSSDPGPWAADDEAAVVLLVHQIGGILHAVRGTAREIARNPESARALTERHNIDLATGILMARHGCSDEAARTRLGQMTSSGQLPVASVAQTLIEQANSEAHRWQKDRPT